MKGAFFLFFIVSEIGENASDEVFSPVSLINDCCIYTIKVK